MRSAVPLIARVMAELPKAGLMEYEVIGLIERQVADAPGWKWGPKKMGVGDFFHHLVHKGALQDDGTDSYTCPTPSFRRYLIRKGGLDPHATPKDADESYGF